VTAESLGAGELQVRPLRADDRDAVAQLLRETGQFREPEVAVAIQLFDLGVALHGALPRDPSYVFVGAEQDGALAGFVCYGATPATDGTYDVYWIAVRHDVQGRGVGRALLAYAERTVRAAGARLLVIETSGGERYERTRAFYEHAGYEELARVRDFYALGEDRVIFARRVRGDVATG
jgi:ribosomal protein S18 acetylase RimI-like enzyme